VLTTNPEITRREAQRVLDAAAGQPGLHLQSRTRHVTQRQN
jgi:hypothetical protein